MFPSHVAGSAGSQPPASHWPATLQLPVLHSPQLPPQPSLPHSRPSQLGVHMPVLTPQSLQSVPMAQRSVTDPSPPSSHSPSLECLHVSEHRPAVVQSASQVQPTVHTESRSHSQRQSLGHELESSVASHTASPHADPGPMSSPPESLPGVPESPPGVPESLPGVPESRWPLPVSADESSPHPARTNKNNKQ